MIAGLALAISALFAPVMFGQTPADFGDFADPPIPTLLHSTIGVAGRVGPFHLDTAHEWIGFSGASSTTLEPDAKLFDEDDGTVDIRNVYIPGGFSRTGRVSVPVTTDGDAAVRYLNVAADLNGDGVFRSFSAGLYTQWEWLVCNLPIAFREESKWVVSLFTLYFPTGGPVAVRATLTTELIDPALFGSNGWDGSGPVGGFARGETEDHQSVPVRDYFYNLISTGVNLMPSIVPSPPFPPGTPPPPGAPVTEPPRGPRGGPAPAPKIAQAPNDGVPPYVPESPLPPRTQNGGDEVVASGSVPGMPDIKQGAEECAPTAAANSLRYLLDKSGNPPQDGDGFNRDLQNRLKEAMKTNQGSPGTQLAPDNPEADNFVQGKKRAQITSVLADAKVTTQQANPSADNITAAIDAGKDVEIVVSRMNPDGTVAARHMVTVVGYVRHADGTVELKVHDPNDLQDGETPGQTVQPPREHSLIIQPGPAGKGGLRVKGMVRDGHDPNIEDDGDTYVIEMLYTEELAANTLNASVNSPPT
ncbi:MAG: C39 family peptidase, partial [Pseudomonadota bacterium]